MKRVIIIGAGDLGQQFYHFITHYLDDTMRIGGKILDKPVRSGLKNLNQLDFSLFDCTALGIEFKDLNFKLDLILKLKKMVSLYIRIFILQHFLIKLL